MLRLAPDDALEQGNPTGQAKDNYRKIQQRTPPRNAGRPILPQVRGRHNQIPITVPSQCRVSLTTTNKKLRDSQREAHRQHDKRELDHLTSSSASGGSRQPRRDRPIVSRPASQGCLLGGQKRLGGITPTSPGSNKRARFGGLGSRLTPTERSSPPPEAWPAPRAPAARECRSERTRPGTDLHARSRRARRPAAGQPTQPA